MSLEKRIKNNVNGFTKTEQKVLAYFLENKKSVAFLSIHELSEKLKLGRASILRFANKLGYDGYAALKKEIIEELKNDITPIEKFKVILDDKSVKHFSINQIAEDEVKNINHLINNFEEKKFNKAAQLISKAGNIYIAGIGLSHYMSGLTSYLLQRVGHRAFHLNNSSLSFIEQLVNLRSEDLLITFSFPPYSPGTIDAAEFAKKQDAKVISITNSVASPVTNYSDVYLQVKTENKNFTNSMTPLIVLIYTLLDEVAAKDKKRTMEAFDKLISSRK